MKIPSEAKLVFKGIIFDVYQWQQKMFDGSLETFEMLKRPDTVEVIATSGDKILLSYQSQPNKADFYSLFGGRAEQGEYPLDTAKRELFEESGLQSDDWELYKVFKPAHKIEWSIYIFIARNCKKTAKQQLDSGEKIQIIERTFDEFIKDVLSDKYWGNEFIMEILKMKVDHTLEELRKKLFKS